MKVFRFLLVAAVLVASIAALAQMGGGQGGGHRGHGQMPSVDDRVQQLTQQVGP